MYGRPYRQILQLDGWLWSYKISFNIQWILQWLRGNGKRKNMMAYYLRKDYGFDFDDIGKLANNIVDATWMAIIGI